MNELQLAYAEGFVKAAQEIGFTQGQAIDLLKYAGSNTTPQSASAPASFTTKALGGLTSAGNALKSVYDRQANVSSNINQALPGAFSKITSGVNDFARQAPPVLGGIMNNVAKGYTNALGQADQATTTGLNLLKQNLGSWGDSALGATTNTLSAARPAIDAGWGGFAQALNAQKDQEAAVQGIGDTLQGIAGKFDVNSDNILKLISPSAEQRKAIDSLLPGTPDPDFRNTGPQFYDTTTRGVGLDGHTFPQRNFPWEFNTLPSRYTADSQSELDYNKAIAHRAND